MDITSLTLKPRSLISQSWKEQRSPSEGYPQYPDLISKGQITSSNTHCLSDHKTIIVN